MSSTRSTDVPASVAALAITTCAIRAVSLLARGQLRQPGEHRGRRLTFADGTTAPVYRETVVRRSAPAEPAVLVVCFRLRLVSGAAGHAAFRAESLLNTGLFVGFGGFVSKLWLANDERGVYRGFYQWDGPELAERYVGALRHVLRLVCVPSSIEHQVLPGRIRDDVLRRASPPQHGQEASREWWRPVAVAPPLS